MSVHVFMFGDARGGSWPENWAYGHLTDDRKTPLCGDEIDDRWTLLHIHSITEDATCKECLAVCSHSRLTTLLYIIQAESTDFYKVGITMNMERRLRSLQTATPLALTVVSQSLLCVDHSARAIEREIHAMFALQRPVAKYQREWFVLSAEDVERARAHIEAGVLADRRNVARWVRLAKRAAQPVAPKKRRK